MASLYKKPYIDSDVWIGWIKNEKISKMVDGVLVTVERGEIGKHVLELAEQRVYPIFISPLTFAEVQKKKGQARLEDDENDNVIDYFQHDFVNVIPIDRSLGEHANKLCRTYEAERLSPNDAIHLACAIKAGCDVLLSWDGPLNLIECDEIRIENPQIWIPARIPIQEDLFAQKEKLEINVEQVEIAETITTEVATAMAADAGGAREAQAEATPVMMAAPLEAQTDDADEQESVNEDDQ